MRMPFKTSRQVAPLILATATLSLLALHCGDDGGTTTGTAGTATQPTSGSGGTASQGGSSAGMTTGGVTTAGTAAGGTGTAGTGTAGTGTAGAAGSSGGHGGGGAGGASGGGASGGSSGGSAGGASGGSGGGSSGPTFAQVKDLLAMSCKGSKCHDAGNQGKQVDLVTSDGLYTRLTTPLPDTTAHCVGNTPVVANMPTMSLLVQAVTGPGKISCNKSGGGTEMIARMPDDCPTARPCLTDAQIKLISDWVAAGAKM
jgi:hypothetical protein